MKKVPAMELSEMYDEIELLKFINELKIFHFRNGSYHRRFGEQPDSFMTILKFKSFSNLVEFLKDILKISLVDYSDALHFNEKVDFIQSQLYNAYESLHLKIDNYSDLVLEFSINSDNGKFSEEFIQKVKKLDLILSEEKVKLNYDRIYNDPNILNRYIYPEIFIRHFK